MAVQPPDLTRGLDAIEEAVSDHCQHGAQSNALAPALACGQFYGEDVRDRSQRGLHGTAAAIGILLASKKSPYVAVAKKILHYVKDRLSIEKAQSHDEAQIQDDQSNTIKQAEILAAINDLADEPAYASDLTQRLRQGQHAANGAWSFFLDDFEVGTSSDVASCYAVLALHSRVPSDELAKSREYLWNKQRTLADPAKSDDIMAIAQRSLILYVLAVSESDSSNRRKDLTVAVKSLWNHCRRKYQSPSEVIIEYHRRDKNHYLRLPWQIYLAHALLCVDASFFYSIGFQRYLVTLNEAASRGGYVFDYAGPYHSTRTNGILHSFLSYASGSRPQPSWGFRIRDWFGEVWTKPLVRLVVIFVLAFSVLLLSDLWKNKLEAHGPLWSEFIVAGFTTFFAWLYGTGKR